jgi:Ca2+-transporting ATPase
MLYYNKSSTATLKELGSNSHGLSQNEVRIRQKKYGANALVIKGTPWWKVVAEPFADVFMLVLLVAAIISILNGEVLDAVIIVVIMLVGAIIEYVQRYSTAKVLRALRKKSLATVTVVRAGHTTHIDVTRLVPGDVVTLREGEKVPADARLISAVNVRVDESLLTGESLPIEKIAETLAGKRAVFEQDNMLFSGSFIVAGEATAVIVATGNHTEFGRLAALAKPVETRSPVQKKIDKLVRQIISIVAGIAVVAFVLALIQGTTIPEALRFVMALAVSVVPESLPVAITVVLVLGMRRMARKKALVRTMRAIETVGVLTTIATDKTGTLTKNKLSVQEVWRPEHSSVSLAEKVYASVNGSGTELFDPLDSALTEYAKSHKAHKHAGTPLFSLPFDQNVALSGNVWRSADEYELTVKGAPEAIIARADITEDEREEAELTLQKLTSEGYRVIAIASTALRDPIDSFDDLPKSTRFELNGFVAIADQVRREAKRAIQAALDAGVTVRMITGDHFETAYHIARELGMVDSRKQVFDARRMEHMTDAQLNKTVRDIRVFSRVLPENKYRLLTALKRNNITAMTGDGVNDVPALANAHVGIAMGSGSQIAKDTGDIILLDDNFKTIIDAMREGRTIIANVRRMLYYLLGTNAGEAIIMIGALAMGMPVPLVPIQILWVNLVTDTTMAIPLGLEKGEKHIMKQRPEKPTAPILSAYLITRMVIVAMSMAVITLTLYIIFSAQYGHDYAQTIAFCSLVTMQWAAALNARSDYESIFVRLFRWNGPFWAGLVIAVLLQIIATFGPLQNLLHITPVAIGDLYITGLIAFVVPILLVEIHKFFGRKQLRARLNTQS